VEKVETRKTRQLPSRHNVGRIMSEGYSGNRQNRKTGVCSVSF
jgi:hypothetical protein